MHKKIINLIQYVSGYNCEGYISIELLQGLLLFSLILFFNKF